MLKISWKPTGISPQNDTVQTQRENKSTLRQLRMNNNSQYHLEMGL
jgi:P pilus assembly chaperone PapD